MDINDSSPGTPGTAAVSRKPYEKPSFRYEQVFVTTALTCGKTDPTQALCHSHQSAS